MAISRFSVAPRLTSPVNSINIDGAVQTLTNLQAKTDMSYNLISDTLDYLNTPGLVAEKDRPYLENKIKQATDTLNNYGNVDLSDPSVTRQLLRDAKSPALDKEVVGMMNSQANYKQLVSRYDKLKSDPKLRSNYSAINEKLDMQAVNDWQSGKTKYLGLNSPTLYTDTDKFLGDVAKEIKPRLSTTINGMYLENNKIRSLDDVSTTLGSTIATRPDIQMQLQRNAKVMFEGNSPEQIRTIATTLNQREIDSIKADIKAKNEILLRPDISTEQKADLKNGLKQMDSMLQEKINSNEALKTSPLSQEQLDNISYQAYVRNYVKGIAQQYIQEDKVLTANPVMMQRERFNSDLVKQRNQFTHAEQMQNQRIAFEAQQENNKLALEAAKIYGKNPEAAQRILGGDFAGGLGAYQAGEYINLPTTQAQSNVTPQNEIKDTVSSLQRANVSLSKKMVATIIQKNQPELAHKLGAILDEGNNSPLDFKDIRAKYSLSPPMLKVLAEYEQLQNNLTDPNKITAELNNNPLLQQYGQIRNQMLRNTVQIDGLNKVINDESDKLYKEWKAQGKVDNRQQFDAWLNEREPVANQYYLNSGGMGVRSNNTDAYKLSEALKERLGTNPNYKKFNEFNSMQAIAPKDKVWNDDESGRSAAVKEYIYNGFTDQSGKVKGINGRLDIGDVNRGGGSIDNIDPSKTKVAGFVDSKNRVYYDLYTNDKEAAPVRGYVELSDDVYRQLRNTSASQVVNGAFGRNLYNSKQGMGDNYFNLNGDIKMGGNVQYQFDMFKPDEYQLTVAMPTSAGSEKKVIATFPGVDGDIKGKDFLIDVYTKTRNQVQQALRTANPQVSQQEIDTRTLSEFYQTLERLNYGN